VLSSVVRTVSGRARFSALQGAVAVDSSEPLEPFEQMESFVEFEALSCALSSSCSASSCSTCSGGSGLRFQGFEVSGFGVWDLGSRGQDLGVRVAGLGVWGLGFMSSRFEVCGLWFVVCGLGVRGDLRLVPCILSSEARHLLEGLADARRVILLLLAGRVATRGIGAECQNGALPNVKSPPPDAPPFDPRPLGTCGCRVFVLGCRV